MYKSFYGLKHNPFELSPDPSFFFATPAHQEALASLCYGIQKRKGFIVLTGEVGTGKTLLMRLLIDALHRNAVPYCYIVNPLFTPIELLHYMLLDFGLSADNTSRSELLLKLNKYLIDVYRRGLSPVLLVDEAHLMNWDLLEEIRLLTNLETSRQKLLQIVLSGQTELDRRLDTRELRQLKQRVVFRCQLRPLIPEEVRGYVVQRLERAGAGDRKSTIFPESTLAMIAKYSGGIPRLINCLCEGALINAYARREPTISPAAVDEVAADLHINEVSSTVSEPDLKEDDTSAAVRAFFRLLHSLERNSGTTSDRHFHPRSPRT